MGESGRAGKQVTGERGNPPHVLHSAPIAAVLAADPSADTTLTAAPGDVALLPCYTGVAVATRLTTWTKNGREVARRGGSSEGPSGGGRRITVLPDGSASIAAVTSEDAGDYLCTSALEDNRTFTARVLLSVTGELLPLSLTDCSCCQLCCMFGWLFVLGSQCHDQKKKTNQRLSAWQNNDEYDPLSSLVILYLFTSAPKK